MKRARISLLLILLLVLLLPEGLIFRSGRFHSSDGVHAQSSRTIQTPPAKKKKTPAKDNDEDRPQGQTAIAVSVDLVSMQVLVTDQKGNTITGLEQGNFTVYEDNVKQEITHFTPVDANITVVMLVEFSRQVTYLIEEIWNAIFGFAGSLRQGDWVAVIGYDMKPTILCDFTQDRSKLNDALRRFMIPAFIDSNLSDAVIDTLDRLEEIDGKVAILLVSTGLDTFSRHTYNEMMEKCRSASASIYAVSVGQSLRLRMEARGMLSQEQNMDLILSDNRLRTIADLTGGEAFFPRFESEMPSIFKNISVMLRNQYSIAYASSNTKRDGKFRKIRVEVDAEIMDKGKPVKLKVMTRKGYQAKAE